MATLLDDLDAFYLERRGRGALDTGVEAGRVWMTCGCGVGLSPSGAALLDCPDSSIRFFKKATVSNRPTESREAIE